MTPPSRKWYWLVSVLALVALQALVFAPSLDFEFLKYDDDVYVYENANIQTLNAESIAWMFARPYYHAYTPLALLSHAVDYRVWGDSPRGHHLTNVVLHALNSILVLLFGVQLFQITRKEDKGVVVQAPADPGAQPVARSRPKVSYETAGIVGAFFAAAAFSVHPMRVESVAWISDRKDLLLAFFVLLSVMAYLAYHHRRERKHAMLWYLASLIAFVFAALSKSVAVIIPVILIFFDALLPNGPAKATTRKSLLLEKVPFFLVSFVFIAVAMLSARGTRMSDIVADFTLLQDVLLPFYSVMFYPAKMLWPVQLTPVYGPPELPVMILAAVLCIGVTALTIIAARRGNRWWLLAWLSYLVAILPTTTGLSAGIQPWADRYSYLPVVGLMLLAGAGVRALWRKVEVRGALLVSSTAIPLILIVVALAGLSMRQLPMWQSGEMLWRHAIAGAPELPRPYANLGVVLDSKGDHGSALGLYAKAVEIEPGYADALYNAGVAYEAMEFPDSAALFYARAIAADSMHDDACVNLGNLHVRAGNLDEGIRLFQRAMTIDDSNPDPYYNMGIAAFSKGERTRAVECFQAAVNRAPRHADAYHNMGVVYLDLGDGDAALECFRRAARLGLVDSQNLLQSRGYTW